MTSPKEVESSLIRQYRKDKYGKLHKLLEKAGVPTDLYVGIGMEMYYPSEEDKIWCFNVFDEQNTIVVFVLPKRLAYEQKEILNRSVAIAKQLNYVVKDYARLSKKEIEDLGLS